MNESKISTIAELIGERIRQLREENGISQEEMARNARRRFGLQWKQATIALIESGKRELSVEEIIVLCFLFNRQLFALLPKDDGRWVRLTPETMVRMGILSEVFSGKIQGGPPRLDIDSPEEREFAGNIPVFLSENLMWYEAAPDVTQNAARKLGVSPVKVAEAARKLWGRSLHDEREHRIAERIQDKEPRTAQALRGHVTRVLLGEIQSILTGKKGSGKKTGKKRR